jgi:hypothetical protein
LDPPLDRQTLGFTYGGLVAGEGSFSVSVLSVRLADGSPRRRFSFEVGMAKRDRTLIEGLRAFLGAGSIHDEPSRRGWQPVTRFSIRSHRAHRAVTIPFAERFLLPCAKRRQFEEWRAALDTYEAEHPTRWGLGPSPCSVPGCGRPVRGRGLCRSHYYPATGY